MFSSTVQSLLFIASPYARMQCLLTPSVSLAALSPSTGSGQIPSFLGPGELQRLKYNEDCRRGFGKKDAERIAWLEEFLPKNFPKARIRIFGYNADWFANAPDKTSKHCARELLSALSSQRGDAKVTVAMLLVVSRTVV